MGSKMIENGIRKGQFFILGAILISSVVLGFTLAGEQFYTSSSTESLESIVENNVNEFLKAGNVALRENRTPKNVLNVLKSEINFQEQIASSKGYDYDSLFIIGSSSRGDLNISIVNFFDGATQVNLSIDDSIRELNNIKYRQEKEVVFSSIPQKFELDVNISTSKGELSKSFSIRKDILLIHHLEMQTDSERWVKTRKG